MTNYEGTTPPRPDPAPAERGPAWALVLSEVFQAPLVLAALLVVRRHIPAPGKELAVLGTSGAGPIANEA